MCRGAYESVERRHSHNRLTRCPSCAYQLAGLPDHHRCPECGFPYELDTVVFPQLRWPWIAVCLGNGVLFLAGILILLWRAQVNIALVGGAVGLAGTAWRVLQAKRFVLVSGTSLRVVTQNEPERRFEIESIVGATWSRVDGAVEVHTHDGATLVRIPKSVLWSHRRSRELAATIGRFAEAARARNPGDDRRSESDE